MSWPTQFERHATISVQNRDYAIVPLENEQARYRIKAHRSEPQRFDDPELKNVEEYTYAQLPPSKKRIRLLRLKGGMIQGPEIFCELIEADYDNEFHIPTTPNDKEEDSSKVADINASKYEKERDLQNTHTRTTLNDEEDNVGVTDMNAIGVDNDKEQTELEKEKELALRARCVEIKKEEIKYEALSWCWGNSTEDYCVRIECGDKTYKKRVRKELALALKYLRKPDTTRTLWIDAICINQNDSRERNQQVQMMSRVYTRAQRVCIWLGEDTDESKVAIDFISDKITKLNDFDTISSDRKYTEQWRALMMLMQRDWFSRRWVVQEIALAKRATIYCGPDEIPWKDFAVAVELFVEVETATHRLSEVMQKDEKFRHVPGWFEHVSELGASLLVQATGKVFRAQRTPLDDANEDDESPEMFEQMIKEVHTIDPLDRRSLLSLEYLVTTMFIFNATECRDSIYSMLAIARDANPFAESTLRPDDVSFLTMTLCDSFLAEKPFIVDYARPYADVCRDFVEFCILRTKKLDPVQALDILCRPWALNPQKHKSDRSPKNKRKADQIEFRERLWPERSSFKKKKRRIHVETTITWQNVDDAYEPGEEREDRDMLRYFKKSQEEFDHRKKDKHTEKSKAEEYLECLKGVAETDPKENVAKVNRRNGSIQKESSGKSNGGKDGGAKRNRGPASDAKSNRGLERGPYGQADHELDLPSWVARASKAPFKIFGHPGIHVSKTGRANADPLVGMPRDGHRNYCAAQTKSVLPSEPKFKKRPVMGHYSLYVSGFELDEVDEVRDASQGGDIPQSWLELGDWNEPYDSDPPPDFWRTIVADRGHDNRNPPYYYARACKESVLKGGIASGRVATSDLINNERNSIIAEFCRRVQAVIWGRSLFKTKEGRLGLGTGVRRGDKICILYGCTVPVVLQEIKKGKGDSEKEDFEDKFQSFIHVMQKLEKKCVRKAKYQNDPKYKDNWKMDVKKNTAVENANIASRIEEAERRKLNEDVEKESMNDAEKKREADKKKREAEKKKKGEKQNYHVFKGESYIHGLMDGEALRERFYKTFEDKVFELR